MRTYETFEHIFKTYLISKRPLDKDKTISLVEIYEMFDLDGNDSDETMKTFRRAIDRNLLIPLMKDYVASHNYNSWRTDAVSEGNFERLELILKSNLPAIVEKRNRELIDMMFKRSGPSFGEFMETMKPKFTSVLNKFSDLKSRESNDEEYSTVCLEIANTYREVVDWVDDNYHEILNGNTYLDMIYKKNIMLANGWEYQSRGQYEEAVDRFETANNIEIRLLSLKHHPDFIDLAKEFQ